MRAFAPVPDGWASGLETWEREFLAGLLDQLVGILEADAAAPATSTPPRPRPDGPDGAPGAGGATTPGRQGETAHDLAVLASLDFSAPEPRARDDAPEDLGTDPAGATDDPDAAAGRDGGGDVPASLAPLLDVLLPDASEDPDVAVEVSAMTRSRLRAQKHARLEVVTAELLEPSGEAGAVLVRTGEEPDWLGALNDARLVLAQRLDIEDADDAEDVHSLAFEDVPEGEDETARSRRAMALAYDMITWWQESLVAALLHREEPS